MPKSSLVLDRSAFEPRTFRSAPSSGVRGQYEFCAARGLDRIFRIY